MEHPESKRPRVAKQFRKTFAEESVDDRHDRGATLTDATTPEGFDRLTPLATVRAALLAALRPVAPVVLPLAQARGRIAARTIFAERAMPAARIALRDGWAVASRETIGASPYAPVYVAARPSVVRAGAPMPEGADAVLPPHAVSEDATGIAILQAVAPGADTREAGGDVAIGTVIAAAGDRLRADRVAMLGLAGVECVPLRVPRVHVSGPDASSIRTLMETSAREAGAEIGAGDDIDLTMILCEPGQAGTAPAVARLAREGRVLAHGLALRPGEAIGVGLAPKPTGGSAMVIVVPDRLDDAMAAWLLLIAPCLDALAESIAAARRDMRPLARKIVSAPGLADLVLLRSVGLPEAPVWEPIATGDPSWSAFSRADAYCLVAPESEGVAAGERVVGILL